MERALKLFNLALLLSLLAATLSCGSDSQPASTASTISGNWQFTLVRHNSTEQWTFSGFLLQSGNAITGSVILNAAGCQGVGPVTGTFDGQNLQITVSAFGQDFSLSNTSGTSQGDSMSGQFTDTAGGCISFSSAGVWTAVRIPALSGNFSGSFVSPGATTINVTGTLIQGQNVGASTATLSGTISATGSPSFCSYIGNSTVTGLISGTSVTLTLFGPDGSQIGQIPGPGSPPATVAADAKTLTGGFNFPAISSSCTGFTAGQTGGGVTLSFQ